MKNSHKVLAATACLSTMLFPATTGAFAQAPAAPAGGLKIGTVDRDKVVQHYSKAQQIVEDLKKGEEKIAKLVESANKQYEDAKKANKPPAELEALQKRLQTQIDEEVKKFQSQAVALDNQVMDEMDRAIKAEASTHGVNLVLMKQAVLLGGTDITEGVVKRLASSSAQAKTK